MKNDSKKKSLDKIHIIGGGPAGLSVGYYANKLDIDVRVFEASSSIGGNCKTLIDGPFRYDTGAHRLHDKNKSITKEIKILLGNSLKRVTSPSKIYYEQKFYNFPIKISDLVSNLSFSVITQIIFENLFIRLKRKESIKHFKDLAYNSYGKTISKMFLIPYTEKLWGDDSENLDTSITGGRLKELNLKSLIKDMVSLRTSDSDHMEGDFYYPKLGFGEIFNAIGLKIGMDKIFLNREISRINHDNEKILSFIDSNGTISDVENLVFTASLNILIESLNPSPPKKIVEVLNTINFRTLMICVIYLDMKNFSSNASIYFSDPSCPFTRIYEPKNRSDQMSPKEKTSIVIEVPIGDRNIDDSLSKDDIYDKVIKYLQSEKLIDKEKIINYKLVKVNDTYPIITADSKNKIEKIKNYLAKFKNLDLIGRNATFEYLHTHDIMERSRTLINKMAS